MNNEFTEPTDELKRVAEEITLLRKDLQEASSALSRIERRLKAAFPNYPQKPKQTKGKGQSDKTYSSKTPHELQAIFEDLVARTLNGGDAAFLERLSALNEEDIIALSLELGMGSRSRLSRNKAADGVRKRVQEAMLLQFKTKKDLQQSNQGDGE